MNFLKLIIGKIKTASNDLEISKHSGDRVVENLSIDQDGLKNSSFSDSQGRSYVQKSPNSIESSNTSSHQSIPPYSIYEIPIPKYKADVVTKDLGATVIGSISPGVNVTMRTSIQMSGVIPATVEEVDECFSELEWFIGSTDMMNPEFYLLQYSSPFDQLFSTDKSFEDFKSLSPLSFDRFIKALRAKIRELNKTKEDDTIYLEAFFKAIYLKDLAEEFELKGTYKDTKFSIAQAKFILSGEVLEMLMRMPLDFKKIGYELFPSFGKADVKWLVKRFGNPISHLSPINLIMDLKKIAVINYFQSEREKNPSYYKNSDSLLDSLGWSLKVAINSCLGFHKSWYQRISNKGLLKQFGADYLKQAVAVMGGEFIVADLETTGLDPASHEIIEIGAMLISPNGNEISRFESLVNSGVQISAEITQITGITNEMVESSGIPPAEALSKFIDYVGNRPIFFHNSRFDSGFLRVASEKWSVRLSNTIFDSLTLSRCSWSGLQSYSLLNLSTHLGIDKPTHRAFSDVVSTHQLLIKIKDKYLNSK
jgi:DNA polymerase-3 subunit epsilon